MLTGDSALRKDVTLIETVAAAGLLVVAMGFLVDFSLQGLRQVEVSSNGTRGALLAQGKMEEIIAICDASSGTPRETLEESFPHHPGTNRRPFDDKELDNFEWSWDIREWDQSPNFHALTVTVYWRPGGRQEAEQDFELSCLVRNSRGTQTGGSR
ncbi:MAG: type IV pilus modification PilV family protein [Planctomycetota bacterium]